MRILILDDMEIRHQTFRQNLIGHTLTHAYKADDAIKAFRRSERFDLAFLDRDLDDHATMGLTPTEKTGEDVVDYMVRKMPKEKYPTYVVVHSWNIAAAIRMHTRLWEAGFRSRREPFHMKIGV